MRPLTRRVEAEAVTGPDKNKPGKKAVDRPQVTIRQAPYPRQTTCPANEYLAAREKKEG